MRLGGGERLGQPLRCCQWDLEDQEKEQPPSPVAVRGQEEELSTTSGNGNDPVLPAKPAHLGSAWLQSSGANFSVRQGIYYGPSKSAHSLVPFFSRFGPFQGPVARGKPSAAVT